MLNRRSFLVGSGAIALGTLLGGCGSRNPASLRVQLLNGSLPQQLIREFRSLSGQPTQFTPIAQFKEVFQLLQDWQEIARGEKNRRTLPRLGAGGERSHSSGCEFSNIGGYLVN